MPASSTTLPIKHHPNLKGSEPRTRLAGGPFVDTTTTLAQFSAWAASGVSQGVLIDRLTTFALTMGFDPVSEQFTGVTDLTAYPRAVASLPEKISPASPKSRRG